MTILVKPPLMTRPAIPDYRADVDGLRAVAVLAVLAFHAFPGAIPGGFVGVDIFFVISGFLISTIIIKGMGNRTFSFLTFYRRRVMRIFPALLVILAASLIFGLIVLLPNELQQLSKHVAAGAAFTSNLALWSESGYFDADANTKPLLHLWSLGIEEQFYIVWPVALWLALKCRIKPIFVILAVAAISFYLNIRWLHGDPTGTFYSPLTRAWELLIGAALAWALLNGQRVMDAHPPSAAVNTTKNLAAFVGACLIAFALATFTQKTAFPGWPAVVPVAAATLLIAAGPSAWINRVILSNKIAVAIGLISFPLYLWHWPILSFARIITGDVPSVTTRLVALLATFVLAWLTFRMIELPVRFQRRGGWTMAPILMIVMLVVGSAGYVIYRDKGFPSRIANLKELQPFLEAGTAWEYPGSMERLTFDNQQIFRQASKGHNTTLFIGDSNMEMYYPRIDELIKTQPEKTSTALFVTNGGCLPIPDAVYAPAFQHCIGFTQEALKMAEEQPDIKRVVIAAQWGGYLNQDGWGLVGKTGPGTPLTKELLSNLEKYIGAFKSIGKDVYLILNIPTGANFYPTYGMSRNALNYPAVFSIEAGGAPLSDVKSAIAEISNELIGSATAAGATIISPLDFLCARDYCPNIDAGGDIMYRDGFHLHPSYVRHKLTFLDQMVSD